MIMNRINLKKMMLMQILILVSTWVRAQMNPVDGFVITNQGDTIHGVIDYRSDTKNGQSCMFKQQGTTEYKEYFPSDIQGYRFASDGVYYVSRTFPVDGQEKLIFAEYLLQGGVSLYHHKIGEVDYYFMVDDDGKVATIRDTKPNFSTTVADNDERWSYKRGILTEAGQLLAKSPKALQQIWSQDLTSRNLTNIVKAYDEEFCTSSGACIVYQYDEKKSRFFKTKFRVDVGVGMPNINIVNTKDASNNFKQTAFAPSLGIGMEILLPRVSRHLSVETSLLFSYASASQQDPPKKFANPKPKKEFSFSCLQLHLGPCYTFQPEKKFSPLVHAGFNASVMPKITVENMTDYYLGRVHYQNGSCTKLSERFGFGVYLGAGANMRVADHQIRLTANYNYDRYMAIDTKIHTFNVNAAFIF